MHVAWEDIRVMDSQCGHSAIHPALILKQDLKLQESFFYQSTVNSMAIANHAKRLEH